MTDPEPSRPHRWRPPGPPENEIPQPVDLAAVVLGRSPDAVVFLTSAVAFSTGVLLKAGARVRLRTHVERLRRHGALMGMPWGGPEAEGPDRRFMLGIQLADGTKMIMKSPVDPVVREPGAGDGPLFVATLGAVLGDLGSDLQYWLQPLPPPGPVLLVLRWEGLGIAETVTELDGAAMASAGMATVTLWPVAPLEDPQFRPPPPPSSGWFASPDSG